jgi:hypothetical protein
MNEIWHHKKFEISSKELENEEHSTDYIVEKF